MEKNRKDPLPAFSRGTWESVEIVSRIGRGGIGGKAAGLVLMADSLLWQATQSASATPG